MTYNKGSIDKNNFRSILITNDILQNLKAKIRRTKDVGSSIKESGKTIS